MATAAIKRHWSAVAALACLICNRPAQVAHMHGPSLRERNPRFLKAKGVKLPAFDWLVAPLCPQHHSLCDNNPYVFAREHGTPAELLDRVCELLGVDVWELALQEMKPQPLSDRQDSCEEAT